MARTLLNLPSVKAPTARVAIAISAVSALQGCLLYTDPINSPPTVDIHPPAAPLYRGETATFTARPRDPDGDSVTIEWSHAEGACPDPVTRETRPATLGIGSTYQVDTRGFPSDDFCVWALATDRHGAWAIGAATATTVMRPVPPPPPNQPPVALIDIQQPEPGPSGNFPLYSDLRLSGARSFDPERAPLTFAWSFTIFPPATKAMFPGPCAGAPTDPVQCFTADVPGTYAVQLVVSDGDKSSGAASRMIIADDDVPPCIEVTLPAFDTAVVVLDPAVDREFAVSRVKDDGDPFPRGPHSDDPEAQGLSPFVWSLQRGAGALEVIAGYDLPALTIAKGTFGVGERAALRVEVRDRKWQLPERSLTTACGTQPICGVKAGCHQRVTWMLEYR